MRPIWNIHYELSVIDDGEPELDVGQDFEATQIHADISPHISHPDDPKFFFRDESRIRYEPVQSTAAVNGHDYVLPCTELAQVPVIGKRGSWR